MTGSHCGEHLPRELEALGLISSTEKISLYYTSSRENTECNFCVQQEWCSEARVSFSRTVLEKCHLLNVEGMMQLGNHHLTTTNEIIVSGKDLLWMLKAKGVRLMETKYPHRARVSPHRH